MRYLFSIFLTFFVVMFFLEVQPVFAHEQYVLTKQQLEIGLNDKSLNVLTALSNQTNIEISVLVGIGITILLLVYFFFQYSKLGLKLDRLLSPLEPIGHVVLRFALAASLIMSAHFQSFLGPEIPVTSLPLNNILIPVMYAIGILLLFGIFTRLAATVGFLILLLATVVYGDYITTYFNYYGEYLALIIFGSYALSADKKIFGRSPLVKKYKDLELLIIRVTYGVSVLYPAITIKLMHPKVIVEIVNEYHLNQFHWLFPQDPLLISLGTGLAQILVGAMIIIGFETRLASLTTFFLYLLSVLFFKEAVWPHYVLLALALYLVLNNGGKLSLDQLIKSKLKRVG